MASGLDLLGEVAEKDVEVVQGATSGLDLLDVEQPKPTVQPTASPSGPSPDYVSAVRRYYESGQNPFVAQLVPGYLGLSERPEPMGGWKDGVALDETGKPYKGQEIKKESKPEDDVTSFRQGTEPSFIQSIVDEASNLFMDKAKESARNTYRLVLAEDLDVRPSQVSPDLTDAFYAGVGRGVHGLISQVHEGRWYPKVAEKAMPELSTAQRIAMSAGGMVSDLPYMGLGAAAGSSGGPIGTIAGAFALPQGLRALYSHMLDKGEITNPKEFMEVLKESSIVTAKGAVTGIATGVIGAAAAPLGKAMQFGAEAGTMNVVGSAMEGQLPTMQGFIDTAILLGGFKGLTNVSKTAGRLKDLWVKTGMKPEDAKTDPEIAKVILEEGNIPEDIISKAKAKVEEVEKVQADLVARQELAKQKVEPEEVIKEELKIKGEKVRKEKVKRVKEPEAEAEAVEESEAVPEEAAKTGIELLERKEKVRKIPKRTKKTEPITEEDYQKQADALKITFNGMQERLNKPPLPMFTDNKTGTTFTLEEGESVRQALGRKRKEYKVAKPEPITEVDEQTGTPTPDELKPDVHPFRDTDPEHTNTMSKLFAEKVKQKDADPEVFTRYMINEVNRWLNGEEPARPIKELREGLSQIAANAENVAHRFDMRQDFENWKNTVVEAAKWARESDRSNVKRTGETQLNMMIPVDQIPKQVKEILKDIKSTVGNVLHRNRDIWEKTGFWYGRDGKWRYEIDDSNLLLRDGTIEHATQPGKFSEGGLPAFIGRHEILKAIPELYKVRVIIGQDIKGKGYYSPETKTIHVGKKDIQSTFIHELQHAVNDIVGSKFRGSSVQTEQARKTTDLFSALDRVIKDPYVRGEFSRYVAQYNSGWPEKVENYAKRLRDKSVDPSEKAGIERALNKYLESSAFEEYLKDPGEMESRLASRRYLMSEEKRKAEPPWNTLDRMLREEGLLTQEEHVTGTGVGIKLYSGIPIDEATKSIIAGAKRLSEYTKKARGMKAWKPTVAANRLKEEFTRSFVDRSGNIRRDLLDSLGDDGYEIIQKMYLSKGASSLAAQQLKQMRNEVYAGLSGNEKRILDNLILADRMLDIGKYKTTAQFKFPEGLTPTESAAYNELFQFTEGITSGRAAILKQRAQAYFEWMKKPLKDMLDAELITQEEYDALASHNYRRLKLVDIYDRRYQAKTGKRKRTVYDSGVEALSHGRETDIFEPSSEVMALEVFNRAYGRILNNEANQTLLKLGREWKDNPFVAIKDSPKDRIPTGWDRVFVYEKGERKAIYLSPEMAKEWINSSPEMSYKMSQLLRYVSGSPVLRTFATGIDWGFALANLPRDIMHAWYATRVFEGGKWKPLYSSNMPVFMWQMEKDIKGVFNDAVMRKGRYEDYIREGGGMEFLVHQGRLLQRGRHIEGSLDKVQDVLGYFGETSEIITRLAIRDRVIKRRAKELGISYEEAVKNKDITREATFAARDYMDFGQGGGIGKAIDNAIPYLNAAIQGTRGMFRAFKDNPADSTWKLTQFAALVTGLYIANRSGNPETMQALQGNIDMQGNLCIPLGDGFAFQDERGQTRYPYFKIPLDPGQKFFKTFFEASTDKMMGNPVDAEAVANSLTQISPVGISSLPPTVGSVLGYVSNKDFWLNEDIWKRTEKPLPWPQSKEEYIPGKTPQAMIDVGQLTGLSPERLKYSLEELVTGGSMWSWLAGAGYEGLLGDLPKEKKEFHLAEVLSKMPVIRRFIGVTNPYSQFAKPIDAARDESMVKRWVENRGLDQRVEAYLYEDGERSDVIDYIKGFKDKDTCDRLKDRFVFSEKIKDLPNRSFWLALKGTPDTEARARIYVERLNSSTPDEAEQMMKELAIVQRAGGIVSDDFRKEVMRLREQQTVK